MADGFDQCLSFLVQFNERSYVNMQLEKTTFQTQQAWEEFPAAIAYTRDVITNHDRINFEKQNTQTRIHAKWL